MAKSYDISDIIKNAFTTRLIAEFNVTAIDGISEVPIITRTITNNTPEPYIYIRSEGSLETWVTKDSEDREYRIMAEVVVKHKVNSGTHKSREQISNEVIKILTQDVYPDITSDGFRISNLFTEDVAKIDFIERGAKYYKAIIPFAVVAGLDPASAGQNDPVQAVTFTKTGFEVVDSNDNIDLYDNGTITFANTYPSSNNGWDFTGVAYTANASNTGSTLADNVATVLDTGTVAINSAISYELESDPTRTFDLSSVNTFNRIVSFRYGVISSNGGSKPSFTDNNDSIYGLRNLTNWKGTGKSITAGTKNPNGNTITFNGIKDEYMYLITENDVNNITNLNHETIVDHNIIGEFDTPVIIGNFKVYIQTNPLAYTNDITVQITI